MRTKITEKNNKKSILLMMAGKILVVLFVRT